MVLTPVELCEKYLLTLHKPLLQINEILRVHFNLSSLISGVSSLENICTLSYLQICKNFDPAVADFLVKWLQINENIALYPVEI